MSETAKYKIISLVESCKETGEARVRIQVYGKGRTFVKKVKELYQRHWLEDFSREDVAYIGAIIGLDTKIDKRQLNQFPREKQYSMVLSIFISMFIITFLIIANIGSAKIAYFDFGFLGTYYFPSSVIFFPLVFLFTDIGTELLGFATCRKIIWASFFGLAILVFALQVTIKLPASPYWLNQSEYAFILGQTPKIFIASACAFLIGDLINAYILSKLKKLTSGRFFIFRALGSTLVGAFIDSLMFVNIAYWGKYPLTVMWNMIFTESIIKVAGEAVVLPVTALLLFVLNKFVERNYEFSSKLNPFSIPNEEKI